MRMSLVGGFEMVKEHRPQSTSNTRDTRQPRLKWYSLSRFDRNVLTVLGFLIIGIIGMILLGDRVGTQVVTFFPAEKGRSTDSIILTFSEPMDHDSVMQHFRIDPAVIGQYLWSGTRMVFQPSHPLPTGSIYKVSLTKGAKSSAEREVQADFQFQFTVQPPRVAYLTPADGSSPMNIWIAETANPSTAQQVTFSSTSINSFDVSPDGRKIAFSAKGDHEGLDIWLLDLASKNVQQLTDCQDSACTLPLWRPDGKLIAYTRSFMNTNLTGKLAAGVGLRGGLPRVWLLDTTTSPYSTRQLVEDSQVLGTAINWSVDGNRLNYFNIDTGISMVYDFAQARTFTIENPYGQAAALSPDGKQVIYPQFVKANDSQSLVLRLQMQDLANQHIQDLSGSQDNLLADSNPVWQPGGQHIVFARREKKPSQGSQIYLLNPAADQLQLLVTDPDRTSNNFVWDSSGEQILIQRFKIGTDAGQAGSGLPEIWSYVLKNGAFNQLVTNAVDPHWIP